MIELKKEFIRKGVAYQQIFRDEELIIYELSQPFINDPCEIITWFEVFKPKTHIADKYHNDEYEMYPHDECFGLWAWSCSNEKCVEKVLKKHFPNHKLINKLPKCHN